MNIWCILFFSFIVLAQGASIKKIKNILEKNTRLQEQSELSKLPASYYYPLKVNEKLDGETNGKYAIKISSKCEKFAKITIKAALDKLNPKYSYSVIGVMKGTIGGKPKIYWTVSGPPLTAARLSTISEAINDDKYEYVDPAKIADGIREKFEAHFPKTPQLPEMYFKQAIIGKNYFRKWENDKGYPRYRFAAVFQRQKAGRLWKELDEGAAVGNCAAIRLFYYRFFVLGKDFTPTCMAEAYYKAKSFSILDNAFEQQTYENGDTIPSCLSCRQLIPKLYDDYAALPDPEQEDQAQEEDGEGGEQEQEYGDVVDESPEGGDEEEKEVF